MASVGRTTPDPDPSEGDGKGSMVNTPYKGAQALTAGPTKIWGDDGARRPALGDAEQRIQRTS